MPTTEELQRQMEDIAGRKRAALQNSQVERWGGSEADREHWLRVAGEADQAINSLESQASQGKSRKGLPGVFQKALGRLPDNNETDFLLKLLDQGDISLFEIEQVLGGLPEAQESRLKAQGKQLEGFLGASDQEILGRAGDVARSQAVLRGRPESSAIGSQIASAGRDLGINRQNLLAQFYGGGLGDISQNYLSRGQGSLERAYGFGDERRQYERDMGLAQYWYNRQQNDYNTALNAFNRKNRMRGIAGLAGASIGAGIGGVLGNKYGGVLGRFLGARTGSGIGAGVGDLF